jgi:hypothetical protein
MNELGCLPLDGGDNFGMAMTSCHHGYAGREVKEGIAVDVLNQSAEAASRNQGITPCVGWRDVPPIPFDRPFGVGPGQRSDQARQFRMR